MACDVTFILRPVHLILMTCNVHPHMYVSLTIRFIATSYSNVFDFLIDMVREEIARVQPTVQSFEPAAYIDAWKAKDAAGLHARATVLPSLVGERVTLRR
jgi:hypothetical protein